MNGLLAIAAAFLDLMTNPQHGIEVNEEYSLRFHQALIDDPEFANSFATLALSAEDVESLPICAWPWYLQWRAGRVFFPNRASHDGKPDSWIVGVVEERVKEISRRRGAVSRTPLQVPRPRADGQ